MGLAYTIDTPIKVAKFGISSVMSIVEDNLIEMTRKYYSSIFNIPYLPITNKENDYRAKRITEYLNLVNYIVQLQIEEIKANEFLPNNDIVKYFEMLPNEHHLKAVYNTMLATDKESEIIQLQAYLRSNIVAGSIDVNIMTKVDKNNTNQLGEIIVDGSDAVAALRGYANSNLTNSAVVFSAGLNPRLYNYLDQCTAFEPNADGTFNKRVIVKVSDYRSALIQGKYLAKKGIWVSEFRVESGLNCGGHAFATDGFLLGPILEEFKNEKQTLVNALFDIYQNITFQKTGKQLLHAPALSFSVQGGIGTSEENNLLLTHYNIQSTGWGTPFLLVPQATTVDEHTLRLLCKAKENDLELSNNSPLGIRFHYLKGTTSDTEKHARIKNGKPGSPCTEKHLSFNTEFTTEPICTASTKYQQLKIASLQKQNLSEKNLSEQNFKTEIEAVVAKECLCVGLSNAAALCYNEVLVKKNTAVNICPGPNIVNFTKVETLESMVNHIYGRINIMTNSNRPNFFIAELYLYIDFLKEQMFNTSTFLIQEKKEKYIKNFCENLRNGIAYYKQFAHIITTDIQKFISALEKTELEIDVLNYK